jgi:hypothetical protein
MEPGGLQALTHWPVAGGGWPEEEIASSSADLKELDCIFQKKNRVFVIKVRDPFVKNIMYVRRIIGREVKANQALYSLHAII